MSLMLESLTLVLACNLKPNTRRRASMAAYWKVKTPNLTTSLLTILLTLSMLLGIAIGPAGAAKSSPITSVFIISWPGGMKMEISIVKIVDPGKPEWGPPPAGDRWVGVDFKIKNTGRVALDEGLSTDVTIVDTSGETDPTGDNDLRNCPVVGNGIGVAQVAVGSFVTGCEAFAVPKKYKVRYVEFDSKPPSIWKVS